MPAIMTAAVEQAFLVLPRAEREAIIGYGAAVRLSSLKKRKFLAQSKDRYFETKYHTTLEQLESDGLPDDANFEMHEDYVMWHHWHDVSLIVDQDIARLEKITDQGLYNMDVDNAGG
jgi:hypothetical protein